MWNKIKRYAIGIIIPLAVGGIAAYLTRDNMNIYSDIRTPPLSPPAILFPIVWIVLYILMGISSVTVAIDPVANEEKKREARLVYAASLVLNFAWSIIFFNYRAFGIAFVCIALLLGSIIKTIFEYREVNKAAAIMQIPYAIWVAFATYLNVGIWILN